MIRNVIGLGHCGCRIVDTFEGFGDYLLYRINTEGIDVKNPRNLLLEKQNEPEQYEEKIPDLRKYFRGINEHTLFVVGGSGMLSSGALAILQQIKHVPIHILYICPDRNFLSQQDRQLDRLAFGALQEMARSGLFERIWLVSNPTIEQISEGIPVGKYWNVLNETIVSTFHAIQTYANDEPIAGSLEGMPLGTRISTFGIVNGKNEDCLYFPLDTITDKQYVYVRSEETLNTDKKLMTKIKNDVLAKSQPDKDKIEPRVSFIVNEGSHDFTYVMAHTSFVQEF